MERDVNAPPHVLYVLDYDAWLVDCDVDGRDGRGVTVLTKHLDEARVFPNLRATMDYWTRQSTVTPLRDDGKPNRPLTAFSVSPQMLRPGPTIEDR